MGAFKNPAIVFLLTIVVLFKSCQCSRSSNGVVRSIFFLAYKPLRLDFGYFKNGDFSEDNMVLIRSSKFGAKSLSKNFFRKTNVEFYCSLSEYCLIIGEKVNKPKIFLYSFRSKNSVY
jgi:hypothetical protein